MFVVFTFLVVISAVVGLCCGSRVATCVIASIGTLRDAALREMSAWVGEGSVIGSMSWKFREKGDTELLDGVCVYASDWHGWRSSPSAVAMCRSCGGVANVTKVDSIDVVKVLCEAVW